MAITYRDEKGANLTAAEVDANFRSLVTMINAVSAAGPKEITGVTVSGAAMTFELSDGSEIGPVNLPVANFNWRGDWAASTAYVRGDLVRAYNTNVSPATLGWYAVQTDHTSDAGGFDPSAGGGALYRLVIPLAYAMECAWFFPGSPGAGIDGIMFSYLAARPFTLKAGLSGSRAVLRVAPLDDMSFEIQKGGVSLGSIDFESGSTEGTFSFDDDVAVSAGEQVLVYPPNDVDGAALDLAVTLLGYLS